MFFSRYQKFYSEFEFFSFIVQPICYFTKATKVWRAKIINNQNWSLKERFSYQTNQGFIPVITVS